MRIEDRVGGFLKASMFVLILVVVFPLGARAGAGGSGGESESSQGSETSDLEIRIRELEIKIRELTAALEALTESAVALDATRLAELERKIELLTREIERLKLGEAAEPVALESKYGFGPAASKVYQVRKGVSIGGYGELVYQDFESEADNGSSSGTTDTLDLLRVVLYFGYKFNDRILFNTEIEFEHATTGAGDEDKGEVSVEFAYLDFLMKGGFNARGGLLLVPLGFVNELHEPPVFHGVLRPRVERFILPTTWRENGAGIFGDLGKFSYRAYLMAGLRATEFSAGSAIRGGRQGGSKSRAEDLALTGRLDLTGFPGFLAGVSFLAGDSGQGEIGADAQVTVWDAHVQYEWRGLRLRGLWASGSIDDVEAINAELGIVPGDSDSVGEKFGGWYTEVAWDVLSLRPGATLSLSPFVRYEEFDTQEKVPGGFQRDPSFDREVLTVGLTWKPISQVAIKVDYMNFDNEAGTAVDQLNVGLGWLF